MKRWNASVSAVAASLLVFAGCADDGSDSYGYYAGDYDYPGVDDGAYDAGGAFDALSLGDVTEPAPEYGVITVSYLTQSDPAWASVRDQIRERAYLDAVAESFTESFALPDDLDVKVGLCDTANAFYDPNRRDIFMCLELLVSMYSAFAGTGIWDDATSVDRAHLGFLWVYAHELGHAFWDVFEIASLGSEEDAADDFATILLIEAGLGWAVLSGADYFAMVENGAVTRPAIADEHGLGIERLYNAACLLYGSDPSTYGAVLESLPDLVPRAARCPAEYADKLEDLGSLLEPHLRQD